ncbi:MAG: glutathione S-transferase, partial [Candidatus Dadabacteria bacterium]|nr:glutathione S-transferase [Candidatus Dadabacteria bacterium]
VADMACYPYIMLCPEGGMELEEYSNVFNWIKKIETQQGYTKMED